jgi:hypothetical protein
MRSRRQAARRPAIVAERDDPARPWLTMGEPAWKHPGFGPGFDGPPRNRPAREHPDPATRPRRRVREPHQGAPIVPSNPLVSIDVLQGNALTLQADVLALKHAQTLYGLDKVVFEKLTATGAGLDPPPIGRHLLVPSGDAVASGQVLFVGVERLRDFNYREVRDFGRRVLEVLWQDAPSARHVAMTIHGPGYGLDESESFKSQVAGILESIEQHHIPPALERLTFVERDPERVRRLAKVLAELLPAGMSGDFRANPPAGLSHAAESTLRAAGRTSDAKPRVFVAMPFADEMSDLFHYGIQGAVHAAGLLAERADLASFTGDVVDWVQARISSARLVVADLTTSNPNVFLEVGYAWGKGIPTVLLAASEEPLKFDVRGQRCLRYSSIKDLEEKLRKELVALAPHP